MLSRRNAIISVDNQPALDRTLIPEMLQNMCDEREESRCVMATERIFNGLS
jgi:hypothetical protein